MKGLILAFVIASSCVIALPSQRFARNAYLPAAPVAVQAYAPGVAAVPAVAAVPTVTEIHTQKVIPQAPTVVTQAHPTTQLATVKVGDAVVGHQHVGDQVVGKTPDVSGFAFTSETRHDAPVPVVAAPAPVIAAPAPVVAAPVPVVAAAPAVPVVAHAAVLSSHVVSPLAAPAVFGVPTVVSAPAPVPVVAAPVVAAPAPVVAAPIAAYKS